MRWGEVNDAVSNLYHSGCGEHKQTPRSQHSRSDNWNSRSVTNGRVRVDIYSMQSLDTGMSHILGGQNRTMQDFLTLLRMAGTQFKTYELFSSRTFFSFLVVLGFELRASHLPDRWSITWATPLALFCVVYFQDRILLTISLGWLWTSILLISASWVARITGVSHWCLAVWHFMCHVFGPQLTLGNWNSGKWNHRCGGGTEAIIYGALTVHLVLCTRSTQMSQLCDAGAVIICPPIQGMELSAKCRGSMTSPRSACDQQNWCLRLLTTNF
jgi:hypothetical protein